MYAHLVISPQITFQDVSFLLRELPLMSPCETWISVANADLGQRAVFSGYWVIFIMMQNLLPQNPLSPKKAPEDQV